MKISHIFAALSLACLTATANEVDFVVNKITIKGVDVTQQSALIKQTGLKSGSRVNEVAIRKAIQNLLYLKKFKDIEVEKVGNNLVFKVSLVPTVAKISIKGNKLIASEQLLKSFNENGLLIGEPLNTELVKNLTTELTQVYKAQGYANAVITDNFVKRADGTVDVEINVQENEQLKLTQLNIKGNEHFSTNQIISDARLKPNSFFLNQYTTSRLTSANQQDLANDILNFYRQHGYALVKINSFDVVPLDKEKAAINIDLTEGKKYNYGNTILISNNKSLEPELQKEITGITAGSVFDGSQVNSTVNKIQNKLGTLGYFNNKVKPILNPNPTDPNAINISFTVETGSKFLVRRIEFVGNILTEDNVLRREIGQSENAVLNTSLLDQAKIALNRTGYFSSVEYEARPVEGTLDQVDVIYTVVERNTGSANVGLGIGTGTGVSLQAALRHDNFLGTGNKAAISLSKSRATTSLSLSFENPYFTTSRVSLGGSIYYNQYDSSKVSNNSLASYRSKSYGASVKSSIPVSELGSLYASISLASSSVDRVLPEFFRKLYLEALDPKSVATSNWSIKYRDLSFTAGYSYSSLNRGFFPTKGLYADVNTSLVYAASTNKYASINLSLNNYFELGKQSGFILLTKASYNHLNGMDKKRIPISNLLSAGGPDSVRGFGYSSIGPSAVYPAAGDYSSQDSKFTQVSSDVIGGDNMFTGTIEVILPLFKGSNAETLRSSIFYDTSSVWSSTFKTDIAKLGEATQKALLQKGDYSQSLGNARSSVGISLQWLSPAGPLTFSYAVPVQKKKTDVIEKFQFNFGTSF